MRRGGGCACRICVHVNSERACSRCTAVERFGPCVGVAAGFRVFVFLRVAAVGGVYMRCRSSSPGENS